MLAASFRTFGNEIFTSLPPDNVRVLACSRLVGNLIFKAYRRWRSGWHYLSRVFAFRITKVVRWGADVPVYETLEIQSGVGEIFRQINQTAQYLNVLRWTNLVISLPHDIVGHHAKYADRQTTSRPVLCVAPTTMASPEFLGIGHQAATFLKPVRIFWCQHRVRRHDDAVARWLRPQFLAGRAIFLGAGVIRLNRVVGVRNGSMVLPLEAIGSSRMR